MCLGVPGRLVDRSTETPDLAHVEIDGIVREVNLALLEDDLEPGQWLMVHLGFAMGRLTAEEAEATVATRRLLFEGIGEVPA